MSQSDARDTERKQLIAQLRAAREKERHGAESHGSRTVEASSSDPVKKQPTAEVAFSWDELPSPFPQVPAAVATEGSAFQKTEETRKAKKAEPPKPSKAQEEDAHYPKPFPKKAEGNPYCKATPAQKAMSIKERAKARDKEQLKRKLESAGLDEKSLKKTSIHDTIGPACT
eukprot:NODE_7609_length_755_cov_88.275316_g7360_i0.p1 GENE.NODE_7609_length_755_cov_88.275316_g7360_i0~~NODE_7609_length_755_cov_88.275316_g7360_i0.p1  ORF type:complete len:189 (+),score=49.20 NODE_7609_length_755_cov_88.275316_g7360_i0:57-569(+)